jgi:SNF2 family DNA or RNA helicase
LDARSAVAVQVGFLREAALCPWALDTARSLVPGVPKGRAQFNPKLWTILEIIAECLERGEQVVIGSPFKAFSQRLKILVDQTGVPVVLLDGDTQPAKRAALAGDFKAGTYRVLIGGLQAMGEGYSFECCPNLILPALDWAFDVNKQFQDRVWRLTSPKPVNIYLPVVAGTTDERLAQLFSEKSDSAGLVLDGELPEDCIEELDLFALLRDAKRIRIKDTSAVDEAQLKARWPELQARLAKAAGTQVTWK